MTGADLANLVNEAALLAARREQDAVSQRDLTDALEKVQLGTARNVVIPEEERSRTAYHEAGHACSGCCSRAPIRSARCRSFRAAARLGVTLSTPEADRYGYDENYLRGRIIGALGGMAAEQEVFNVVTTGAEADLEIVTRIARSMVGRWGMSDRIGRLSVLPAEGDPRMAGDFGSDCSTRSMRKSAGSPTNVTPKRADCSRQNRDKLDSIVRQLLIHETLDEPEVYAAAGIPRPAGAGTAVNPPVAPVGTK